MNFASNSTMIVQLALTVYDGERRKGPTWLPGSFYRCTCIL